ncbi:MAG: DUF559 domain-containing protein [Gemmatimonadales bacterium]|nr:MAG: DUF559 domain-containing protein [Gemmatimonadales bacterium]
MVAPRARAEGAADQPHRRPAPAEGHAPTSPPRRTMSRSGSAAGPPESGAGPPARAGGGATVCPAPAETHERATAPESPEARIRTLALRQHGVATRRQLLDSGMSSSALGRRVDSGRFVPLHRGVYLISAVDPGRAQEMAAVLSGGPSALLSHTSALVLWEVLRAEPPMPFHVTVPGRSRVGRTGITFHRPEGVESDERGVVEGIPVTSPARSLVDAAGLLGRREVAQVVAAVERRGLIPREELAGLPRRYAGHRGIPVLRHVLKGVGDRPFTRSEAERRCLQLIRSAGLPRPETNVTVGPYELDLFWPGENIAIEIDGWAHHSSRGRFEGDRRKDSWLKARGIEVIRLSWRQITRRSTETAVQVGQALALAQSSRAQSAQYSPAQSAQYSPAHSRPCARARDRGRADAGKRQR